MTNVMHGNGKPERLDDYIAWIRKEHGVEHTDKTRRYYEAVATRVAVEFKKSDFWKHLNADLGNSDERYYLASKSYSLFLYKDAPELKTKPYDSVVEKSFRKNVVNNRQWPDPPPGGWVLPSNWLSTIPDIVRTCFVVKYLDGVEFLVSEFNAIADKFRHKTKVDFEAKEDGYYAAHYYVQFPCEVPRPDWDTVKEVVSIELQITTQLQDLIRTLLHKYYEVSRCSHANTKNVKWQWDYKSDEFAANYLGHILHYLEGMIMDVRDHRRRK